MKFTNISSIGPAFLATLISWVVLSNAQVNPNANLSADQIITSENYPVETHYVMTVDGYNLTVFRIPHGLNNTAATKGPVFVQHGLLCSSNDWLLTPANNTLPFMLADQGYDVFIGNARGSNYSSNTENNKYNPKVGTAYWNFTWHEMGVSDLPAVIDFVLNKTGSQQLFYCGHSMGTTMFWVAMSQRPEYNAKIKGMFALAPVAFIGNVKSLVIKLLQPLVLLNALPNLESLLGQGQILPSVLVQYVHQFAPTLCQNITSQLVCNNLLFLIGGYDPYQTTSLVTSNVVGHTPSNTSVRTISHYLQLANNPNRFQQYDWGVLGNMAAYGSLTPPQYNLTKVTAPLYLYWGANDYLADPSDVDLLRSKLPAASVKQFNQVNFSSWNHLDFTYGSDATILVYDSIIANMNNITGS